MKLLRILLFPLALLYGIITAIRNLLYDKGLLKSYTFPVPVIAVGNLSAGGTGKTPQIEYLIRLLSGRYRVATLSRGYKRRSKGFIIADNTVNADILGDEPYQFFRKFPGIKVAVDANRKNGIEQLLALQDKPQIVLLDDAYQHRRVKAGYYILLTAYGDLYNDDFILPTGNLREHRWGAKRADVIIVTKCPAHLTKEDRMKIQYKLKPKPYQKVYFTYISYDDKVYSDIDSLEISEILQHKIAVLAGIAKPDPFINYLACADSISLVYPDHHNFTDKEIAHLRSITDERLIVTTEKDFVRLRGKLPPDKLYYLPIKNNFLVEGADFDKKIIEYIERE